MTLDIIVPHYHEPWSICKPLFDSIALQRGIKFEDIAVIVVNDGAECALEDYLFTGYPYRTEVITKEHSGLSATRNRGMDESDADYVMFCDADDGFLNNYGLHLVFSAMQEEHDYIYSNFVEDKQDHIRRVYCKKGEALPLFELALDNCRNYCNSAGCNTNGEVENKVNSFNGKCCSVDNCAKGKNKCCVDDVCTDDVTN